MSEVLRSTWGKIGLAVAGGVLVLLAAWFLLVSPQRSKASALGADVQAAQVDLQEKQRAVATPSVPVTVKPSDLYRLAKALPDEDDMPGILLDVDRLAKTADLTFASITPAPGILATGYTTQPLVIVVQGRFRNVSGFLGGLRRLVTVQGGRLDAHGRLYDVSKVDIGAPDTPAKLPVVKATVTLNAYTFSKQAPAPTPTAPTTTDASSGTVAAGANP